MTESKRLIGLPATVSNNISDRFNIDMGCGGSRVFLVWLTVQKKKDLTSFDEGEFTVRSSGASEHSKSLKASVPCAEELHSSHCAVENYQYYPRSLAFDWLVSLTILLCSI